MPKCIYCLKDENKTSFNNREHIMPQFLGKFTPLNPIIKGDLTCDRCNSIFSKLETNFKEDSEEGIYSQMLNLDNHGSIRLRGKNVKMKCISGIGEDFFNKTFPFLEVQNDKIVAVFKPHIKLKNYDGVYQIFIPETLKKIKQNKKKFLQIKERMKNLNKKDICIFADANYEGDNKNYNEIVSLLKNFGIINYKEKQGRYANLQNVKGKKLKVNMECTINKDIARVLAKVAFNYFAYCAKQDNREDILFSDEFSPIRNFIYGRDKNLRLKDIIRSIDKDFILGEEKIRDERLIAHIVTFNIDNGNIIASQTFFGKRVYEIIIGEAPQEFLVDNFGCGHVFDPFSKTIINLTQELPVNPTKEGVRASFGLFKRKR